MLVSSLISSIRYRVGDVPKTKFTDERIIELINEGLDDLARKVDINKGEVNLPIVPYQRELIVPDEDFVKLLRVRYNNTPLKIIPFSEIDQIPNWEDVVSSRLEAIVYNIHNPRVVTLYPLLDEAYVKHNKLNKITINDGVIVDIPGVNRDNLDGIITDVEVDTVNSAYTPRGVRPDGTITSIKDGYHFIHLKYTKRLKKVTDTNEDINLNEMFRTTLVYYVSGMLLLDDTRAENINKGLLFVEKYKNELSNVTKLATQAYQSVEVFTVPYRTGFGDEYTEY